MLGLRSSLLSRALSAVLGGVLACTAARAGEPRPCPVDGTQRIAAAPPAAWNVACGRDSDGALYGVDAVGRRRLVETVAPLQCPRCRVCFLPQHLDARLPREAGARLAAQSAAAERAGAERWELVALTCEAYRELHATRGEDPERLLGEAYLRAAWAARGRAVLLGSDGGYRPQGPDEAARALAELERRARWDPARAPEVRVLDDLLAELEEARQALTPLRPSPRALRRRLVAGLRLASLERRLQERKAEALERASRSAGRDRAEVFDALVKASVRYGGPRRWKPWLERLSRMPGRAARARTIRRALGDEARLLGLAGLHFRVAAQRPGLDPAERARLLYLVADGLRRRGETSQARDLLREALRVCDQGEWTAWARAFLAER